ncbi:hypothetical protein BC940DRAFT_321041 [Gongronella butleri]|nr:hypothetical protein BC940DRAFT_321041 [Gongronella butleri]
MSDAQHDHKDTIHGRQRAPSYTKSFPLTTEEPVRRTWLNNTLKDLNSVPTTPYSHAPDGVSSSAHETSTLSTDSSSSDEEDPDDMKNKIGASDEDEDGTVTPPVLSVESPSAVQSSAPPDAHEPTDSSASATHTRPPLSSQHLRSGITQMDLLWNEMESRQWEEESAGESSADEMDEELRKTTEANRHIEVEGAAVVVQRQQSLVHDAQLRKLLCFADVEQLTEGRDSLKMTMIYGAGSHGNLVRKDTKTTEIMQSDPAKRTYRNKYLVACDFSHESLYAIEWLAGTMLRDRDELHIITVSNREDNPDVVKESGMSEDALLHVALNATIDEAKKRLSKMMLYDVKLVCYSDVGRVKDVLKSTIRKLMPTMVVCGSRGRGTMKGFLMGSISTYLVHKSPVPVAVIRPKKKKRKVKQQLLVPSPLSESMRSGDLHVDELG